MEYLKRGLHERPAELPTAILRSAQLLISPTVIALRNGLALTSFSRVVRPVASAAAIREAASALSAPAARRSREMGKVERTGCDRQTALVQHRGIFLDQPCGDLSRKLGISPQVQHLLVGAALDQIASVPSNGFEPRVIEKLGGASRARPLVPCIRVTIGLGYDNALDQRLGGRPVDRFSVQMRVAKQDETYDESHADRHSKNERDGFRRQPVPRGDNGSTLIGAGRPDFVGTACLL